MVARIAEYNDPSNPAIREITLDNNEAQSNHTQLISASASPSTREIGVVKVTNPLPAAADCRVVVRQTSPFIPHLRRARVGAPAAGRGAGRHVHDRVDARRSDARLTWCGSTANASTRSRTACGSPASPTTTRPATASSPAAPTCSSAPLGPPGSSKFAQDGGLASGRIEAVDNGQGVDGTVLVTLTAPDAPEKEEVREGTVQNGNFRAELGRVRRDWIVQGHYTGDFDLGPCESEQLKAR